MHRFAIFTLFLAFLFASASFAQQPVTLTLDRAIDLALEKNLTVIQTRNSVDASQSSSQAAYGSLLPSLNVSGSFSRQQSWRFNPGDVIWYNGIPITNTAGTSYQAINSFSTGISSSVMLFNGFSNTSNVMRASANVNAAQYNLDRTNQTTVYNTYGQFLNIYKAGELVKVNDDNLKRDQRQLERIVESNKVGAVALADVYRQQVQVGNDELALIQAQSTFENAKADFLAYLGVDVNAEYMYDFSGIPATIDTSEFPKVNQQYENTARLIEQATASRPDYKAANESFNSADAGVSAARGAVYPSVSAFGSFGYNNTELRTLTDNKNLSLGLSVSLPIFSGFSTQNQIQQAEIGRKNANEALSQAQRQIVVDIRKALLDLEAAEKQLVVTIASIQSADMDRQIAQEKYNLASGTLLDLLIANAGYTNALSNKVNGVVNYMIMKKQMEYAIGIISK